MSSLSLDSFITDDSHYEVLHEIGSGSNSCVYLVEDEDGHDYALKRLSYDLETDREQKLFLREVTILSSIKHPCILAFKAFSLGSTTDRPFIVTEYAPNKSLDRILRLALCDSKVPMWTSTQKLIIIFGIAAALQYLHSKGFVHRDLKPANVLLDENFEPKIGDFGLSKFNSGTPVLEQSEKVGSPLWMAPELYTSDVYTNAIDVYSFGIILYQILTLKTPFPDISTASELRTQVLQGRRPDLPNTIPVPFRRLISSCWAQNPTERPSFAQIIKCLESDECTLDGADMAKCKEYRMKVYPESDEMLKADKEGKVAVERNESAKLEQKWSEIENSQESSMICNKYIAVFGLFVVIALIRMIITI